MADNIGPMAWLFLPENELPQWQQKIALRAENPSGSWYNSEKGRKDEKNTKKVTGQAIIFCEAHFLLPIASLGRDRREQVSTFSGQVSAIEARDAAIFT